MKWHAVGFAVVVVLIINAGISFALPCAREINLLAVVPGEEIGTVAKGYVEMIPGRGRVFIDTLPLTGEDTQASARMAKEAAENFLGSKIGEDVLYTIRADSPSISGPSGGAGLAVLAVASYLCLPVNSDMAITGTINPDGTIGYVGGLEEKIAAAAEEGIGHVVIPYGEKIGDNLSVSDAEEKYNITILEAETLGDAVRYFTGYEKMNAQRNNFTEFRSLMKEIAWMMLQRAEEMAGGGWKNRTDEIREYYEKGEYYTSSSLAFGLWVDIEKAKNMNLSAGELLEKIDSLGKEIESLESSPVVFDSYRDVEIYVVFQERLNDARENLNRSVSIAVLLNGTNATTNSSQLGDAIYYYSYAKQRLETAKIWKSMMGFFSGNMNLSEESLKPLALRRMQMAQAMASYASTIVGSGFAKDGYAEYEKARESYIEGKYALSISHSIKSIASSSLVIEMATAGNITTYLSTKKRVVEKLLEYSPNPSFISWNYKQLADYYFSKSPFIAAVYYKYATVYSTFYEDIIANMGGNGTATDAGGVQAGASGRSACEVTCKAYETDRRKIAAWVLVAWLACVISGNVGRKIVNRKKSWITQ